jgi:hypothetical protein
MDIDALAWRAQSEVDELLTGHLEPTDLNRAVILLHLIAATGSEVGPDDKRLLLSLASELEGLIEGRPSYALDPHVMAQAHGLSGIERVKQSSTADSLKLYCAVAVRAFREFMPASEARALVIKWAADACYVIGDSTLRSWMAIEADLHARTKETDETYGLSETVEAYLPDHKRLKTWLDGFVRVRVSALAKRESYFKELAEDRAAARPV